MAHTRTKKTSFSGLKGKRVVGNQFKGIVVNDPEKENVIILRTAHRLVAFPGSFNYIPVYKWVSVGRGKLLIVPLADAGLFQAE